MAFPEITIGRWIVEGSGRSHAGDPTLRTQFGSGHFQAVRRATFVPRMFRRRLVNLTEAERAAVDDYQVLVGFGAGAFWWVDSQVGHVVARYVRLHEACLPLAFEAYGGVADRYQVEIYFVERSTVTLSPDSVLLKGLQMYRVENLAAGSDIVDRPIYGTILGATLSRLAILTEGAPSGVDDSNTVVVAVKNSAGSTVATKTYNASVQPPSSDLESLGALAITTLGAGDHLTLSVTCGATANMPAFSIIVE
jgi:hypothetical protein